MSLFCYQFSKFMWFQTLKIALAEWKMYNIYMAELTFYHWQDFPEYILIAVFYIFIRNLEVLIKDREKYSSDLGKGLQGEGWQKQVKLSSEACDLDFHNIFQNKLCWKVCHGVCILKIGRNYSFTGALKTRVLLFKKPCLDC